MLSVPPFCGVPVPGLSPCRPLERLVRVELELGALLEPLLPQAVATSASAARPLTATKLRLGVCIDTLLLPIFPLILFADPVTGGSAAPRRDGRPASVSRRVILGASRPKWEPTGYAPGESGS